MTLSPRRLPSPYGKGRNKFGARSRCVMGVKVGSEKEGRRVVELCILQRAGEIRDLEFHPRFDLTVNGVSVGRFTPDSRYVTNQGEVVIEDVKGGRATKTEAYNLRKRVFEACHAPLTVTEV